MEPKKPLCKICGEILPDHLAIYSSMCDECYTGFALREWDEEIDSEDDEI